MSKHFHRTAELVSGLTSSYKAVYDHLAVGAHQLAEMPGSGAAIRFAETKLLVEDGNAESAPAEAEKTGGQAEAPEKPEDGSVKAA